VTALNAGQLPSPQLNTAQINKIVQVSANAQQPVSIVLNPVTVPYTHGREVLRFTTSYQYLNATPQQLQRWTQPLSYKEIFPNKSKALKPQRSTHKDKMQTLKSVSDWGLLVFLLILKCVLAIPKPLKITSMPMAVIYVISKVKFNSYPKAITLY
jgi:hypothetical protein